MAIGSDTSGCIECHRTGSAPSRNEIDLAGEGRSGILIRTGIFLPSFRASLRAGLATRPLLRTPNARSAFRTERSFIEDELCETRVDANSRRRAAAIRGDPRDWEEDEEGRNANELAAQTIATTIVGPPLT
jgi:hypothetical protein